MSSATTNEAGLMIPIDPNPPKGGSEGHSGNHAGPVSPTLAQEVSYINGLNPDGTVTSNSFWGYSGETANKWGPSTAGTGATITYVFDPSSNFTATEKATFVRAFAQWSSVANVQFVETSSTSSADVLLHRGSDGSAYETGPTTTGSGSTLGSHTGQALISIDTSTFGFDLSGSLDTAGGYGYQTAVHEIGHLLGLGHGGPYNGNVTPSTDQYSAYDERQYTLMSYIYWGNTDAKYHDSYPVTGTNWGVTDDGIDRQSPHSVMQADILAIQQLYGTPSNAQTAFNGGETFGFHSNITSPLSAVFDFTQNTHPVVTLYDQGTGNTLDLSGYAQAAKVDLNAGAFSSAGGLTNNISIAQSTLIERAVGGSGGDTMLGNQAANTLTGNNGNDTLIGSEGADQLYGSNNDDTLYGDGAPGGTSGVGSGSGSVTKASGAGNVDRAHAIDVTNTFSLASNGNIIDSTTTPHVTISGTGDGNRDYYKVMVNAGTTLTFDIDATNNLDSFIKLYDAAGNVVAYDDDSSTSDGAGGSTSGLDSYLTYDVQTGGTYYIEVGAYASSTTNQPIASGATYQLQVSAAFDSSPVGSGSGNDILDGGAGADNLYGGAGDDKYYVDNAGDTIHENAGQGTDNVYARADYTLTSGASIEYLRAFAGSTGLKLTGNDQSNAVVGGVGADTLDGGSAGTDKLYGGAGNDTYVITRTSGVTIVENANEGTDTVQASVGHTLAANVENLTLTGTSAINGTGNTLANVITGNGATNTLQGMDGNDTIVGGGGADRLYGNAGSDVFVFKDISDSALTARDGIYDFVEGGTDKIDLSAIDAVQTSGSTGNQAFTFITGGYTGVAGQLRTFASSTTTYVEGDVNGDSKADFQIVLSGVHTLHATDFVL